MQISFPRPYRMIFIGVIPYLPEKSRLTVIRSLHKPGTDALV
jgi:hypothetical protein